MVEFDVQLSNEVEADLDRPMLPLLFDCGGR